MNNGTGTILDNLRMVILDCDGTIVDSQIGIVKVMQQTFEMYDLNIPKPRDVLFGVGLDLIKGIGRLLPDGHNLDIIKMSETYKKLATYHRDNKSFEDQLYPEAEEVIRKLHASGWLLGIATGKSSRGLDHVLSLHDMSELFVTKQTSDRAAGKPNPEMLFNAMDQTGVSAAAHAMSIQTFQIGGIVLLALSVVAQTIIPNDLVERYDEDEKRMVGGKLVAKGTVNRLMSWGFLLGTGLGALQLLLLLQLHCILLIVCIVFICILAILLLITFVVFFLAIVPHHGFISSLGAYINPKPIMVLAGHSTLFNCPVQQNPEFESALGGIIKQSWGK